MLTADRRKETVRCYMLKRRVEITLTELERNRLTELASLDLREWQAEINWLVKWALANYPTPNTAPARPPLADGTHLDNSESGQ